MREETVALSVRGNEEDQVTKYCNTTTSADATLAWNTNPPHKEVCVERQKYDNNMITDYLWSPISS